MPRILTGITPSGTLHIGNYFGAMRPAIELQAGGDAYYFIADYHSMTVITDPAERRAFTLGIARDWLACGLDPAKAVFWRQSDVHEVCELTWLLGSLTPMGLLERAHSYKDKLAKGHAPNFGLFAYPVLMAADILLYGTEVVPVGNDQIQHVEFARDWATKFNLAYVKGFDPADPGGANTGAPGAIKLPNYRHSTQFSYPWVYQALLYKTLLRWSSSVPKASRLDNRIPPTGALIAR